MSSKLVLATITGAGIIGGITMACYCYCEPKDKERSQTEQKPIQVSKPQEMQSNELPGDNNPRSQVQANRPAIGVVVSHFNNQI